MPIRCPFGKSIQRIEVVQHIAVFRVGEKFLDPRIDLFVGKGPFGGDAGGYYCFEAIFECRKRGGRILLTSLIACEREQIAALGGIAIGHANPNQLPNGCLIQITYLLQIVIDVLDMIVIPFLYCYPCHCYIVGSNILFVCLIASSRRSRSSSVLGSFISGF